MAHTRDFGRCRLERVAVLDVGVGVEVLETQPERGERRPQLMRRVGHELSLRLDEIAQLRGHTVEGPGDAPDLLRPVVLVQSRREIAAPDSIGRLLELAQWSSDPTREHHTDGRDRGQDGQAQQTELEPHVADAFVEGRGGIGDTNRAVDHAFTRRRHRRVRDDGIVGMQLTAPRHARALQRGADVVPEDRRHAPDRTRRRRVEHDDPVHVDDHDVRVRPLRGRRDRSGRQRGMRFQRIVDHGRDRVGIVPCIEEQPIMLPVGERDAQRGREQGQRERGQRHVGDDEPPGHASASNR